jgi:hypothetical protein
MKQRPGVMGDLLIFLRRKNNHATARSRIASFV